MKKVFLFSAFLCFIVAMIISTSLTPNASNNLGKQNNNISSKNVNSTGDIERKKDDKTSDLKTEKRAEVLGTTLEFKESKNEKPTEENVEIDVKSVEIKKVNLTKGDKNILIDFNADAQNVDFIGEFRLTAYCPCAKCCDEYAYNRPIDKNGNTIVETASGANAYENHTIAVDPRLIPYGTTVVIEYDGVFYEYVAEDCGGAIKNRRIDIYHNSHIAANEFGIKYGKVYLIKD